MIHMQKHLQHLKSVKPTMSTKYLPPKPPKKPKIRTKSPNKDLRKTVISDKESEKAPVAAAAPIMEDGAIIEEPSKEESLAQITTSLMSPKKPPRFKLKLPGSPEFKKRV
jgi:hypothetical protein